MSPPPKSSQYCRVQGRRMAATISLAAKISGQIMELTPIFWKSSLLRGRRYSWLLMRAKVLRAPRLLASMQAVMLVDSSVVTLTKRWASRTSAFSRSCSEVGLPTMGRISMPVLAKAKFSSLGSRRMMSWRSRESIFARWRPTSPAPAMTTLMPGLLSVRRGSGWPQGCVGRPCRRGCRGRLCCHAR